MGIAMACCMTAYLLVAFNLEFDNYFEDEGVEDIVKVMHHYKSPTGKQDRELLLPIVMAPEVAQEIAGIKDYSRITNLNGTVSYKENGFYENIRFADPSFFKMFSIGLENGSSGNFKDPHSIFLGKEVAKKHFADEDPVGKIMSVELNGSRYDVIVGGVFAKLPLNISFTLDVLLPIDIYLDAYAIRPEQWDSGHMSSVLFKLHDIKQRYNVGEQMNKYVELINQKQENFKSLSFELISFKTPVINGQVSGSDLRLPIPTVALMIFSILAGIILLIACFNLTNTTLALTGRRLKEIGIRKVVGSARSQIIYQYLFEMIITVSLAVIAGFLLAQFIVPQFASMWQLHYGLEDLNKLNLMITLIILLFIAATLAGIYPALLNSRFKPIELLKGQKEIKGTNYLTRTLLVIQFSLSVIVFVAGVVFTENAVYQKQLDFGYDKDNILTVTVHGEQEYNRLKNKLSGIPQIRNIAAAKNHIGPYMAINGTIKFDTVAFKTNIYKVGPNYFSTVGLSIVNGRDFIEDNVHDQETAVVVDKNFVSKFGITNPIDERIIYKDKPYRIIGVVENHISSLKEAHDEEHMFVLSAPAEYRKMILSADAVTLATIESIIEKDWKELFPGKPFESQLQEELVFSEANEYNNNLKQIFFFITILGVLLSVSGIYALANLNVQKRTKEIGIRKVLGASVKNIIKLLNKEFAIILLISAALGSFGGYYMTNALLGELYAQYLDIDFLTLIFCSFVIFIAGIVVTSGTIYRMATANPTETLKSE